MIESVKRPSPSQDPSRKPTSFADALGQPPVENSQYFSELPKDVGNSGDPDVSRAVKLFQQDQNRKIEYKQTNRLSGWIRNLSVIVALVSFAVSPSLAALAMSAFIGAATVNVVTNRTFRRYMGASQGKLTNISRPDQQVVKVGAVARDINATAQKLAQVKLLSHVRYAINDKAWSQMSQQQRLQLIDTRSNKSPSSGIQAQNGILSIISKVMSGNRTTLLEASREDVGRLSLELMLSALPGDASNPLLDGIRKVVSIDDRNMALEQLRQLALSQGFSTGVNTLAPLKNILWEEKRMLKGALQLKYSQLAQAH
jgi:hypothetical protein